MTERIERILAEIPPSDLFADIGCDHGYVAKAVLDRGIGKKVIASDVSAKCLAKAETLLAEYVKEGRCEAVVSDGFDKIDYCDTALIAGMGGEEIIKILKKSDFLPDNLLLSPMKNAKELRKYVTEIGYKTVKDFTFKAADKFYLLIVLSKGEDSLTEEEAEFGRTNVTELPNDFKEWAAAEYAKLTNYASNVRGFAKEEITKKAEKVKKYVDFERPV